MINTSLGEKLAELRADKGLTQQQLSECLHISRATYAYYETGKRTPDLALLLTISKFYGIEISDLINENTISVNANSEIPVAGALGSTSLGAASLPVGLSAMSSVLLKNISAKPPYSKAEKELIGNFRNLSPENQAEITVLIKYKLKHQIKK